MRIGFIFLLLLLCGSRAIAGDICVRNLGSAALALYENHQDFIFSGGRSPPLSDALAAVVNANLDEQKRTGESGLIDWNYWADAQDGELASNAKVSSVIAHGRRAQVELAYKFYPLPGEKPRTKRAIIKLSRTSQGCWLIDDVQHGKRSVMSYLQPQK
jgi:hypothetical protein